MSLYSRLHVLVLTCAGGGDGGADPAERRGDGLIEGWPVVSSPWPLAAHIPRSPSRP